MPTIIPQKNIYRSGEEVIKLYRSGSAINRMYEGGDLIYQKITVPEPTPPTPYTSAVTLYNATGGVIQSDVYSDGLIPSSQYRGRSDIYAVDIEPGIEFIGNAGNGRDYVFAQCPNLSSVTISDTVTYIGGRAFEDVPSLKEVIIPASVVGIGTNAFYNFDDTCTIGFEGPKPSMAMAEDGDLGFGTNIIVLDEYLADYCSALSSYGYNIESGTGNRCQ